MSILKNDKRFTQEGMPKEVQVYALALERYFGTELVWEAMSEKECDEVNDFGEDNLVDWYQFTVPMPGEVMWMNGELMFFEKKGFKANYTLWTHFVDEQHDTNTRYSLDPFENEKGELIWRMDLKSRPSIDPYGS